MKKFNIAIITLVASLAVGGCARSTTIGASKFAKQFKAGSFEYGVDDEALCFFWQAPSGSGSYSIQVADSDGTNTTAQITCSSPDSCLANSGLGSGEVVLDKTSYEVPTEVYCEMFSVSNISIMAQNITSASIQGTSPYDKATQAAKIEIE